jgi:hypothetical protein
MQTREEHLQWCKDRAMAYVESGDLVQAVASMMSDLTKHPETNKSATGILSNLGLLAATQAQNGDRHGVERYIKGFN